MPAPNRLRSSMWSFSSAQHKLRWRWPRPSPPRIRAPGFTTGCWRRGRVRLSTRMSVRFYNELGVYDFYRRDVPGGTDIAVEVPDHHAESGEEMSPRKGTAAAMPAAVEENIFEAIEVRPEQAVSDPAKALKLIREDLG